MRKIAILFYSCIVLTNCGSPAENADPPASETGNDEFLQSIELTVDGDKKIRKSGNSSPFSSFGKKKFTFNFDDTDNDISFYILASMQDLKVGTYQVYNCIGEEDCNDEQRAKQESVLLGFNKTSDHAKSVYNLPSLGLKPLELEITSITSGPTLGLNKTSIIKGRFNGTLAFVMPGPAIAGKPGKVDGQFEVLCLLSE